MPYLIDSDWLIDHLAGAPEALRLLDRLVGDGIAISIITYMEAYQGIERSPDQPLAEAKLQAFVENVPVLEFTPAAARRCAHLRETLRAQGKRVNQRALDLIIAAIALEYDLILVTQNLEDYLDVPELKLYGRD